MTLLSVLSILLLLLAGATAYIFLRVRQEQASIRSWLARKLVSLALGSECTVGCADFSQRGFALSDVRMLNPSPPPGDQNWSREMFAECASIVCEYDGEGLGGILSFIGQWVFQLANGCDFAIGCARNRIQLLRLDGLHLHLEEIDGVTNHSILFADASSVDAAPVERGDMEEAEEETNGVNTTTTKKERRPSATALRRAASSLSVFRGLREGIREGLAAAVGEEVSRAVISAPYEARERNKAKSAFEDAVVVLAEHISVGHLAVSAVTVDGVTMVSGGKQRTLSCDGPWEVKEYEGTRSKLLSLTVAGVMSLLLREQLSLTKQAAAQAAKDALGREALGARIGQGIGQARNGAREVAKGAANEVKEAANEVRQVAKSAVSAMESGASRAREKLMNVSLPMPKLDLGFVGLGEANSRRSAKDLTAS